MFKDVPVSFWSSLLLFSLYLWNSSQLSTGKRGFPKVAGLALCGIAVILFIVSLDASNAGSRWITAAQGTLF